MHTLTLKLETNDAQAHELDKRFRVMCHIHNVLVKRSVKLIGRLSHDTSYQALKTDYLRSGKEEKKALAAQKKSFRESIGLSEYGLQSYIKLCGRRYKKLVSSTQVQKEATRVWKGAEKVLFSDGQHLHFKKEEDFDCIGGKSNTNGAKFDKESLSVVWNGLYLACRKRTSTASVESRIRTEPSSTKRVCLSYGTGCILHAGNRAMKKKHGMSINR